MGVLSVPGEMEELKLAVVEKLGQKKVIGGHKKSVETVVNWFPSHLQGKAKEAIEELVREPDSPVEAYGGGSRQNVRLTSAEAAVEYIEERSGDVPWRLK